MGKKDIAILDLHGIKHADVASECHTFLNDYWDSEQDAHIITGNSEDMRYLVFEVLDQYDVRYEKGAYWNRGYIKVWL